MLRVGCGPRDDSHGIGELWVISWEAYDVGRIRRRGKQLEKKEFRHLFVSRREIGFGVQ